MASQPQAFAASGTRPAYRRLAGLFDVELRPGPDGDLRTLRGGSPMDARSLAGLVQRTGGAGDDVRIVMAGGGRHAAVFAELAGLLGRDVLVSQSGSKPRYSSGDADEVTFVDAATGRPADWLVVQPPAMATALPGWYDTGGGVVRERTGTVTLPLPGGLMLATRADFVARRAAAATLLAGHAELTTVGAAIRAGGFVIGDYTGGHEVADGRRLAASLAELPLYGTEVRMWITWPSDQDERDRLDRNLSKFAETTGAIVWAPEPDATIEVLDSCRDLSVTARDGRPATWRAYSPTLAGAPRFESDADGRLSPAGEFLMLNTDGVPLISVEPARWRSATDRYAALTVRDGLFAIDLTVLPDGRWAVQYAGSGPHILGPREFQRVLRSAGWQGEDLLLLSRYPAATAAGLQRHGRRLADDLRADIWVLPPEADFDVLDGAAQAVDGQGRAVAWQRFAVGEAAHWRVVDGLLLSAPAGTHPAFGGDGASADRTGRGAAGEGPVRRTPPVVREVSRPIEAETGSRGAPSAPAPVNPPPGLIPAAPTAGRPGNAPPARRAEPADDPAVGAHVTPLLGGNPIPDRKLPTGAAAAVDLPPALAATSRDEWERVVTDRTAADRPVTDRPGADRHVTNGQAAGGLQPTEPAPAARTADQPDEARESFPLPPTGRTPSMHTARFRLRHGIYWLADRPRVNAGPVALYVVCAATPDQVAQKGLPTPHLFTVGTLRPPAPDSLRPGENLVRVRVAEAGAVDLSSIDVHVPPTLQLLLSSQGESYLLPAGLLDRVQLLAGFLADPAGGYRPGTEFDGKYPLRLRCTGARHGIDGLPADVPRWPRAADATAYALVPGPRVAAAGGALAMQSAKPRVRAGHRLLRLRVPRRRAIGVRVAAGQLADLSSVHSTAGALADRKVELILPGRDFDQVTVLQVLAPGRLGWRAVPGSGGVTLSDFLASTS